MGFNCVLLVLCDVNKYNVWWKYKDINVEMLFYVLRFWNERYFFCIFWYECDLEDR